MTPNVDRRHYAKYGLRVVSDFLYEIVSSEKSRLLKILTITKKIVRIGAYLTLNKAGLDSKRILSKEEYDTLREYLEANLVISVGGGFINDSFGSVFFIHLFQIFISTALGKTTVICSQSIGPLRGSIHRFITRFILNRVDLVTVREGFSKELLRKMRINTSVFETADMTFALLPYVAQGSQQSPRRKNSLNVGMTVRNWIYPGSRNPTKENIKYITVFSQLVDWLVEELGATIYFIPQVIGPKGDDDRSVARAIYRMAFHKERVHIITSDYSPFDIMNLIREMDVFIGTRMHSNIFSVMVGVPTIAISYEYKTDGIMNMLGLGKWVIPIEQITFETLKEEVDSLLKERSRVVSSIKDSLRSVYHRAMINVELIEKSWISSRRTRSDPLGKEM